MLKIIPSPNIRRNGDVSSFGNACRACYSSRISIDISLVTVCKKNSEVATWLPTFYTTQTKILPCLSGKFKIDHFPNLVIHEVSPFFAVIMIAVFISSNVLVSTRTSQRTAYYNARPY